MLVYFCGSVDRLHFQRVRSCFDATFDNLVTLCGSDIARGELWQGCDPAFSLWPIIYLLAKTQPQGKVVDNRLRFDKHWLMAI